ncbi:MAG: hypothetical protein K2K57_11985 [Oscillospiraceae bacterium]|nr:hypothetical protein [Oscillospiraceae bacterium]
MKKARVFTAFSAFGMSVCFALLSGCSGNSADNINEQFTENVSESITENLSNDTAENTVKNLPGDISENELTEKMPEKSEYEIIKERELTSCTAILREKNGKRTLALETDGVITDEVSVPDNFELLYTGYRTVFEKMDGSPAAWIMAGYKHDSGDNFFIYERCKVYGVTDGRLREAEFFIDGVLQEYITPQIYFSVPDSEKDFTSFLGGGDEPFYGICKFTFDPDNLRFEGKFTDEKELADDSYQTAGDFLSRFMSFLMNEGWCREMELDYSEGIGRDYRNYWLITAPAYADKESYVKTLKELFTEELAEHIYFDLLTTEAAMYDGMPLIIEEENRLYHYCTEGGTHGYEARIEIISQTDEEITARIAYCVYDLIFFPETVLYDDVPEDCYHYMTLVKDSEGLWKISRITFIDTLWNSPTEQDEEDG